MFRNEVLCKAYHLKPLGSDSSQHFRGLHRESVVASVPFFESTEATILVSPDIPKK